MSSMPYWSETPQPKEPPRKTGIAALPVIDSCGQEYGVSFERPPGLPGFTRMILFSREADTGFHSVVDIVECESLRRLRRQFDEFQDNVGTRVQYIGDDDWTVPKGRVSAFHIALKQLEQRQSAQS